MTTKSDIFIYSAAIVSCIIMTVLLTTSSSISYNISEKDIGKAAVETAQDSYMVTTEAFQQQTEKAIVNIEKTMDQSETPAPVQRVAADSHRDGAQAEIGGDPSVGKEDNNEIDRIIIEILLKNNAPRNTALRPVKQDSILDVYSKTAAPEKPVRPSGEYLVKNGDCLFAIAARYSISVGDLMAWNNIKNPDRIQTGQKLIVSDATGKTPSAPGQNSVAASPENQDPAAGTGNPQPSSADFLWPTISHRISSEYGMRHDPFDASRIDFHPAIDIIAPKGDPIYAVQNATVVFAGQQGGYGNLVILRHDNGYLTVYGHTWVNLVHVGQTVRAGQVIAKVGNSGRSTASHLHFEVRKFTRPVNPMSFLSRYISRNTE